MDMINSEITLNRYSFFESLENELLPNMKTEIAFTLESDANLIWQAGADCRVVITKMQLYVPKIIFSSIGQSAYVSRFLKPHKWTYLREMIDRSNSSTQQNGVFKITSAINKPRHVFVWIMDDVNMELQTANPFIFNTFSVSTNPRSLVSCYLEVGNGNNYPILQHNPSTEMTRVFRNVLKYTYSNNDYQGGTMLNATNFATIYPFIYFDLRNQKEDIKDGATILTFKYTLSGTTATDYSVYSLVLYEQDIELISSSGKLMIRS